jgi:hypothetical protein
LPRSEREGETLSLTRCDEPELLVVALLLCMRKPML